MADTDFTSAPKDFGSAHKPLIYDLLNRLNASFARVHRNMAALEAVGIFDPLMMQNLNRQSEQLRAGANYHLLGLCAALKSATGIDSHNHPMSKIHNPTGPASKKGGFVIVQKERRKGDQTQSPGSRYLSGYVSPATGWLMTAAAFSEGTSQRYCPQNALMPS